MSYPQKYYNEAQHVLDTRRRSSMRTAELRRSEITERLPQADALLTELARTAEKLAAIILARSDDAKEQIEALKNENLSMQDKLSELLTKNGYPSDYLDAVYTCAKCRDTGLSENGYCECFKNELKRIAAKELSRSLPIGFFSFESFKLDYYSDAPDKNLNGRSPRSLMEHNYNVCKSFTDDFALPCQGLLMIGNTGLGKTHLSLSVARAVTEKGYSVIYGSVPDLLSRVEDEHFGRGEKTEVLSPIKECDLLVLDDLGAEFATPFYVSCIYDIINTRQMFGRPIIINTNLSATEMKERYSDRVTSRIYSLRGLRFCGNDVRLMLKNS